MADYTPNYNLKKPAQADLYNIADHNSNADIIDTALSNKADKDLSNITGALPIAKGGTGNTTGYVTAGASSSSTIGDKATCEGSDTTASGDTSHAEGYYTTASGMYSHAAGYCTTSNYCQTVVGKYNVEKGITSSYATDSGYLIVGCGTGSSAQANCLRATESKVYGKTYSSSGADYAEMFEWLDGNISNEDRIGKFVTLDGDRIRLVTNKDDYILGVVSGNPSVIGDSHDDQWNGMFEKDIYGRPIYEKVTIPEEKDEEGNVITPETINDQLKVSDKYKNDEEYIPRSQRPEWTAVGLLGKLICIDDGTAEINGYVIPNENSIATISEKKTKYRVMKRIDETHIQIMIL